MFNVHQIRYFFKTLLKLDPFAKKRIIKEFRIIQGRSFITSQQCNTALLSPNDVTHILRKYEFSHDFPSGPVRSYDSNQLPSNSPIEDMRTEALCTLTSGILMGVVDGHSGPACAKVISKRIFTYIAASLLPVDILTKLLADGANIKLIESINEQEGKLNDELNVIYGNSFKEYLSWLLDSHSPDVNVALERAFLKLDSDLSREVLEQYENTKVINSKTLEVALSGAVACVSYIDGPNLHIANAGDCRAVIGVLTEDNEWEARKISKDHNCDNIDELNRIYKEHPDSERDTVIKSNRLLGMLAPSRGLGDFRFKWALDTLKNVAVPIFGNKAIPHNYHTPPYLSAKPEVFYHRLTPKDKFIIIASDGLWDMLSPIEAVKLVGEHMRGKIFFNPLKLPQQNTQLGDINELLTHRKECLQNKPEDRNAATHLIRHAIGSAEFGIDHSKLSCLLSLPSSVCRMYRDDITITVAFFDSEYLRQCPE